MGALFAWILGQPAADVIADDMLECMDGDTVQTSHGASVPLEHARRAMRVWRLAVDANALPWRRGDYAQQDADTVVGHFRLDSIDAAGTVRAGCHTFYRPELERFEAVLAAATSVQS